ncbi:MAG TPA: hypothetical protein VGQ36_04430 [Thermoanaerobaculia bacterium]|jgi:hypothetical protein|nr:hypothetical protein [Thermoanaerobaculia bacterium]
MHVLQPGARFVRPLPDALMAMTFAAAALLDFVPVPPALLQMRDELMFVLIVEGGFLLMQGTLVDIATRLKKRPPWWVAAIIVIGVLLFSGHPLQIVKMAWNSGALVFVPLLISIAERGTILWRIPNRSLIEKIAARALISNRITTGLGVAVLATVAMLTGVFAGSWPILLAGSIYFAVAAFDDWRVRGPAFAERPRVLFGYDPIGITYLEPV